MGTSAEFRLAVRELHLRSLFETIRAINFNAPETELYSIYRYIIRSNAHIDAMALYVKNEEGAFILRSSFGAEQLPPQLHLTEALLATEDISEVPESEEVFHNFYRLVPIKHKDIILAFAFVSQAAHAAATDHLELDFIEALTNIIIVAIENKKMTRRELKQKEYQQQLEIARNVQSLLFPKQLPYNRQISVEASYRPHHSIGGDYYDFIKVSDERFLLCVADVSGKGVPAAILMSNFQAGLRMLTKAEKELPQIVEELNNLILQNSQGENFITAFFLSFNLKEHSLQYINAGHNPPFLLDKNRKMHRLEKGTTILGSFPQLPMLETGTLTGIDKFFLFCYTDGFTETFNEHGEEYGDSKLGSFLKKHYQIDQKELHLQLVQELARYKGEVDYVDDITLLSCRVDATYTSAKATPQTAPAIALVANDE